MEDSELLKELASTSEELNKLKAHCASLKDEATAMENNNNCLLIALEQARQQACVVETLSEQGKTRENELEKVHQLHQRLKPLCSSMLI